MTPFVQIVTTTPTRELAERIARDLVEQRLAGCVQIDGPIHSIYRWQGAIESATEWRCSIKSPADAFAAVQRAIQSLHPYDTPEILALPILAGHPGYLDWLSQSTSDSI